MEPCTGNLENTEWVGVSQHVSEPKERMWLKVAKEKTQERVCGVTPNAGQVFGNPICYAYSTISLISEPY